MYCNKYPEFLRQTFIAKIADYTREQLRPMMLKAREKASSNKLKNLLTHELFEKNHGKSLRKTISDAIKHNRLHLFKSVDPVQEESWWKCIVQ